VRANSFDHIALWVDERDSLSAFLCEVCGMHEIDRQDAFTLVGGDARRGKLTLFDAEGPREPGVLERIGVRVPDLDESVRRALARGSTPRANGGLVVEAPAGVSLELVSAPDGSADLDHVVLGVPDPDETAAALRGLGFHGRDGGVELGSRHVALRRLPARPTARPLLNHLALLVDSVDETLEEAAQQQVEVDRIVDAPNTVAAFVLGPDGIEVEYVEHKAGFALV
jgi:catechol 2,3-dioxygenase-like lactoylglutathione lyase family enzyme